jgi:predicted dehydrogenase
MTSQLRVGIIGANAERGWAHDAHVPALARLPRFTLEAVSARTPETAEAARAAFGARRAFADSFALVRDPDVDLVAITVRVPEHHDLVMAALAAGKHVYCEWPLARTLAEAEEMAAAVTPNSRVMVGLQGLSAPVLRQAIELVRSGAIGAPSVLRVRSPGAGWGSAAPKVYAYLQDKRNGATLATIPGGHTIAALEALVGRYVEVDARNTIRRPEVAILGGEGSVPRTCADHLMVLGKHAGGCVSMLEVVGVDMPEPLELELTGTKGWLKLAGARAGGYQVDQLTLTSSASLPPPPEPVAEGLKGAAANVAEAYARFADDIDAGRPSWPSFDDAVALTRLLDAIDAADTEGRRVSV